MAQRKVILVCDHMSFCSIPVAPFFLHFKHKLCGRSARCERFLFSLFLIDKLLAPVGETQQDKTQQEKTQEGLTPRDRGRRRESSFLPPLLRILFLEGVLKKRIFQNRVRASRSPQLQNRSISPRQKWRNSLFLTILPRKKGFRPKKRYLLSQRFFFCDFLGISQSPFDTDFLFLTVFALKSFDFISQKVTETKNALPPVKTLRFFVNFTTGIFFPAVPPRRGLTSKTVKKREFASSLILLFLVRRNRPILTDARTDARMHAQLWASGRTDARTHALDFEKCVF